MKLVVGLGNPGREYENTRHNIGFIILDNILGNVKWSTKFNGEYYEDNINGEKIIFVKPLSYMNLSGGVVSSFANFYKINNKDIIVIQDDLDLPVGKLRLKIRSSAGGHNGIKDIIASLGTDDFLRIKIGIAKNNNIDTKDYVLGKLGKEDINKIQENGDIVKNIINNYHYDNIQDLMNKYN